MNRPPEKVVEKGWGWELWIVNRAYCGKVLIIEPGKQCSLHYHVVKDEVFYVEKGPVEIEKDGVKEILGAGDIVDIPPRTHHRFRALHEQARIIEFSTHHDDRDTVRIEKGD